MPRHQEYAESLPTPSERLYAAAFADYLAGRSARPALPDGVRESRVAAIEATLRTFAGNGPRP